MSTICLGTEVDPTPLKPGLFLDNYNEPPVVKALSGKQPFGSLMLHGKAETRSWHSAYRGWVLVCCSAKAYSPASHLAIAGETQYRRGLVLLKNEPTAPRSGVAIGIGKLSSVTPMLDEDHCFVQYYPDLFKHLYSLVYRIEPFPVKGSQRWKNLTTAQLHQITIVAQSCRP